MSENKAEELNSKRLDLNHRSIQILPFIAPAKFGEAGSMLLDGPNWQLVFFGSERFASWRSYVLPDRQPTPLGRTNAACRAALLLGANRMPGRNMASARPLARRPRYGPFSAITDSADPANLLRTSRFQAKCEFSHGLCIIPMRQHSAFYGLDIGNRR